MFNIASRNIKIFFRDKTAVFFSLLSVFIIIGLYVLFLGDLISSGMGDMTGARFLCDSWIMAGLLAVGSVTASMGAYGIMVDDTAKGLIRDFKVSPLKRYKLVGGYIIGSFTISVIINIITLVLAEIYIIANGGSLLPITAVLKVLGLILLSTFSSSSMVLFVASFIKSSNAFATASTILGTLIGFLTGVYIPVGNLPEGVQMVIKFFPPSHAGALFRQVMMEEPVATSFAGMPEYAKEIYDVMGVTFSYGDMVATPALHLAVLAASAALFFVLSLIVLSRKSGK